MVIEHCIMACPWNLGRSVLHSELHGGALQSFKVIEGHRIGTNRKFVCDFLLVVHYHQETRLLQRNRAQLVVLKMSGHSKYQIGQIGPNRCKSDQIGYTHYHMDMILCPQLHHCTCIRSTFSLYWIIWILNMRVQNWLNIATVYCLG